MKYLKTAWDRWLAFGKILLAFQTRVLFTAFYFIIMWPVGLGIRFFSDPLDIKRKKTPTSFTPWDHPVPTLKQAHNQY